MANILFDRINWAAVMIEHIEVPRMGEQVFFEENTYEVIGVKHYPLGGKGFKGYSHIKIPFVKVTLQLQ